MRIVYCTFIYPRLLLKQNSDQLILTTKIFTCYLLGVNLNTIYYNVNATYSARQGAVVTDMHIRQFVQS
jgi:hypothetical protein